MTSTGPDLSGFPGLDPVLGARLQRPVVHVATAGSTNDLAWELGSRGAPHGSLVLAEAQEQGRGRMGRRWHSPPGQNLYMSLVLRPGTAPADTPVLCLAAAVGLAEALSAWIKWPNDLVDQRDLKLGGLLAEMEISGGRVEFVVLGIGLNVNQRSFPPDLPAATSMALMTGRLHDRMALLEQILPPLEDRLRQVETHRPAVLRAWRARSRTLGRQVVVEGQEVTAEDLREDGALMVRTGDGRRHAVLAGDVLPVSPDKRASDRKRREPTEYT